jgi:hypothetical protein
MNFLFGGAGDWTQDLINANILPVSYTLIPETNLFKDIIASTCGLHP